MKEVPWGMGFGGRHECDNKHVSNQIQSDLFRNLLGWGFGGRNECDDKHVPNQIKSDLQQSSSI